MTDGQLLELFLGTRDRAAIEAIVCRHGALVLGVCRRMLRREQDIEDAFQATFLVLLRKAAALTGSQTIGNWLYGVCYRTAYKIRARTARSARLADRYRGWLATCFPKPLGGIDEVTPLVDQEIKHLPRKYREPLVLCLLQDRSRAEAARLLGIKEGTLSGRLSRARAMLSDRLHSRGLEASAVAVSLGLALQSGAAPPPGLLAATLEAGFGVTAGLGPNAARAGAMAVSKQIAREMAVASFGVWAAAVACAVLALVVYARPPADGPVPSGVPAAAKRDVPARQRPSDPPAPLAPSHRALLEGGHWLVLGVDAPRGLIAVADATAGAANPVVVAGPGSVLTGGVTVADIPVAAAASVTVDGQQAALSDVRAGMLVNLTWAGSDPAVTRIVATRPRSSGLRCVLRRVDAGARTVSVRVGDKELDVEEMEVAPDAELIEFQVGADGAVSARPLRLDELKVGASVSLRTRVGPDNRLIVDRIQVSWGGSP